MGLEGKKPSSFWDSHWVEHFIIIGLVTLIGMTLIFCHDCNFRSGTAASPCPKCPPCGQVVPNPPGDPGSVGGNAPTPPVIQQPNVPCDQQATFSGQQVYPATQPFDIGEGIGEVTFLFNAREVPDRFLVVFDGNVILDSGFRGDRPFNVLGTMERGEFCKSLEGMPDAITGKKYPYADASHLADGFPRVIYPGSDKMTFTKGKALPSSADVLVYAPHQETGWECLIQCLD